jgi:hypothetical protein
MQRAASTKRQLQVEWTHPSSLFLGKTEAKMIAPKKNKAPPSADIDEGNKIPNNLHS